MRIGCYQQQTGAELQVNKARRGERVFVRYGNDRLHFQYRFNYD